MHVFILWTSLILNSLSSLKLVYLEKSYGHSNIDLDVLDILDPQINLTLTLVTGSWESTRLVSQYYTAFGCFNILEKNELHFKIQGNVSDLSTVFKTIFVQYKCPQKTKLICFATNSKVSIPHYLKSHILGIIGLEQVISLRSNFQVIKKTYHFESFSPPQVAQVYGFQIVVVKAYELALYRWVVILIKVI